MKCEVMLMLILQWDLLYDKKKHIFLLFGQIV